MNKRLQKIVRELMGTGNAVCGCPPSSVQIHKNDRLNLAAAAELVNIGVAVQIGTRCEGDILVYGSAYEHHFGDRARLAKTAGLDA